MVSTVVFSWDLSKETGGRMGCQWDVGVLTHTSMERQPGIHRGFTNKHGDSFANWGYLGNMTRNAGM